MHLLSNSITRKFVDSIPLDDWEIETDTGWHPVTDIHQTIPYTVYHLTFSDGSDLRCADTHILIQEDGAEVFAMNALGCSIVGRNGPLVVTQVVCDEREETMYDVTVDSDDHTFWSNNVLSHNTVTAAACILWYTLFQESKTVAILANKGSAAREVLDRYQIMYENLPIWMQQGVRTWNKGNVELENGSKILTAATSSSGIRGKSVNWLYIDEAAIIPNNVAEEFFASVYPTISSGTTTKILMTSTPLGYNHFWKIWNEAENNRNGFVNLFIPYWEVPGRDDAWAQDQLRTLGEVKFNQEVLCVAGDTMITLRDAETGEEFQISMKEAYDMLNT